ncbi:hypothetical protein RchiOBHm_Chr5g0066781 [Rosa chinensis]|uniref:Uncharacterized protein n=1 Tax=Rosa chinensis TaxID=74649 RepID=A0A2P6QJA4_ROSCH|nr:hypothetical protein RchiOBHm_Chr5g0066781 [Rosa chinensis]
MRLKVLILRISQPNPDSQPGFAGFAASLRRLRSLVFPPFAGFTASLCRLLRRIRSLPSPVASLDSQPPFTGRFAGFAASFLLLHSLDSLVALQPCFAASLHRLRSLASPDSQPPFAGFAASLRRLLRRLDLLAASSLTFVGALDRFREDLDFGMVSIGNRSDFGRNGLFIGKKLKNVLKLRS